MRQPQRQLSSTYSVLPLSYLLWTFGPWLLIFFSNAKTGKASECLVGCTLLGLDPFDADMPVEWDDRGKCTDGAACEVNAWDTEATWAGCGSADASRCLWAAGSGEEGSSDCTCSVCGAPDTSASSYMSDYPTWTRITCYIADMEAMGYDASVCVAAVVDDGVMACVDEPYEGPTFEQVSCPPSSLALTTSSECLFDGSLREAGEMFASIGTPADFDHVIHRLTRQVRDDDDHGGGGDTFPSDGGRAVDTPAPRPGEDADDAGDGSEDFSAWRIILLVIGIPLVVFFSGVGVRACCCKNDCDLLQQQQLLSQWMRIRAVFICDGRPDIL
ncbi:unnamed protein product [Ectocarpus sp. CCAP 1310/34]|nr:unnamed protein product [Ectocarpus sp. CCAP 1310/34]